jgi:carbon-monoxide dehydrogenase medium subunit
MQTFDYHRPASLAGALEALRGAEDGKILAGGQSLLPIMKLDLVGPSALVSLKGIAELRGIDREGDTLRIGAMTTHAEVAESDVVRDAIPGLAAMAHGIGDAQVRNVGTLGGAIAHADPAADYPAALVALEATVVTDRRHIAADDFFRGFFTTALEDDEIITEVTFPVPDKAAYAKFPNPASRYAIVGVMVAARRGGVRVAVTGAGRGVFRVEAMEHALSDEFAAGTLDGIAMAPDDLVSDMDASGEYRAHLLGVMARRAVEACG